MKQYIYKVTPNNPDLEKAPTEEEVSRIKEHFNYLNRATEEGKVILAGRCMDSTFGLVIFYAHCEEEARMFMESDPAVEHNVFSAEMWEFRVALSKDNFC